MEKLSETLVQFIARDKATGHLRIESRGLTLPEVSDYIRKQVIPSNEEYIWNLKVVTI